MSSFLDAIEYAGDALGKGGRAVRGVLAGRPDEALAMLPFSDSLGLTDESRAVSGQQLLNHYGVEDRDGWGGMAVEMLADPLNLVSGAGLASRAGKGVGRAFGAAREALDTPVARDIGRVVASGGDFAQALRGGGDAHASAKAMLPARREFTFLKNLDDAEGVTPFVDRAENAMRAGMDATEAGTAAQQRVIADFQRQIGKVKSVPGDGYDVTFRAVGGKGWRGRGREIDEAARQQSDLYTTGGFGGLFDPQPLVGSTAPQIPAMARIEREMAGLSRTGEAADLAVRQAVRPTERHELVHGISAAARDLAAGKLTDAPVNVALPPALRGVNRLHGGESSLVQGLGAATEEAVAQGMNGRSPLGFLLSPDAGYVEQWTRQHPGLGQARDKARSFRDAIARGASALDALDGTGVTPGRLAAGAGITAATLPAAAGLYYATR